MSGCIWKFSEYLDDEDIMFAQHEFITFKIGEKYYGFGEKSFARIVREAGAVYKIGKIVRINREIFEKYLRKKYKVNKKFEQ